MQVHKIICIVVLECNAGGKQVNEHANSLQREQRLSLPQTGVGDAAAALLGYEYHYQSATYKLHLCLYNTLS